MHDAPDLASPVRAVLRPGAQLDATERRTVGGTEWLHVHARTTPDVDGWVVNDSLLLTARPMTQRVRPAAGWSVLVPAEWAELPETIPRPTFMSSDRGMTLTVQTADSIEHLPAVPSSPGVAEREEGPIDVYGKTAVITVYRLPEGYYELVVQLLWASGRAYAFLMWQPGSDSSLFKQIMASVIFQ